MGEPIFQVEDWSPLEELGGMGEVVQKLNAFLG
jgi:hypothetical protein